MFADILYSQSEAFVILGLLVLLLAAGEAGYRLGRKSRSDSDETRRTQVVNIQGGILGLLGLLLGFTFAMAVARFDSRKQLVVDEANAIGTACLRAQLLPDPQRTEVAQLLRGYLDARLEASREFLEAPARKQFADQAARLQTALWSQAVAASAHDPRAVTTGLFVQALNEVIDVQGKRTAALENHVPESVLVLLFLVAIVAVGFVGYGCGLGNRRASVATVALAMLISMVVLIIVDLDRPRRGLIHVGEQSLIDLKESLEKLNPK